MKRLNVAIKYVKKSKFKYFKKYVQEKGLKEKLIQENTSNNSLINLMKTEL
jgi:hypothetical protein